MTRRIGRMREHSQMYRHLPPILTQLSSLLEAGLSMTQCLQYLNTLSLNAFQRKYVLGLLTAVEYGTSLASVWMDRMPRHLHMLMRAGEESGSLPTAMMRWCTYVEARRQWLQKCVRISAYPACLAVFVLCLLVFVCSHLLPSIVNVNAQLGLHHHTGVIQPNMILQWGPRIAYTVLGGMGICGMMCLVLRRAYPVKWRQMGRWIPGHSAVLMSRTGVFSGTLSTLLEAGLPVAECLDCLASSGPTWMVAAAGVARNNILSGRPLAESFSGTWHEALKVSLTWAEQTGDLPSALRQTHVVLTRQLQLWIEQRLRWLEPVLMTMTGVLVGGVMWLVLTPMYDAVSQISSQTLG